MCVAEEETEDLGKKGSDLQFFAFFCMSLYTSMKASVLFSILRASCQG